MYSSGGLCNKTHGSRTNSWISVDWANLPPRLTPLMAASRLTAPLLNEWRLFEGQTVKVDGRLGTAALFIAARLPGHFPTHPTSLFDGDFH